MVQDPLICEITQLPKYEAMEKRLRSLGPRFQLIVFLGCKSLFRNMVSWLWIWNINLLHFPPLAFRAVATWSKQELNPSISEILSIFDDFLDWLYSPFCHFNPVHISYMSHFLWVWDTVSVTRFLWVLIFWFACRNDQSPSGSAKFQFLSISWWLDIFALHPPEFLEIQQTLWIQGAVAANAST